MEPCCRSITMMFLAPFPRKIWRAAGARSHDCPSGLCPACAAEVWPRHRRPPARQSFLFTIRPAVLAAWWCFPGPALLRAAACFCFLFSRFRLFLSCILERTSAFAGPGGGFA